jgi:hypothetical protein
LLHAVRPSPIATDKIEAIEAVAARRPIVFNVMRFPYSGANVPLATDVRNSGFEVPILVIDPAAVMPATSSRWD